LEGAQGTQRFRGTPVGKHWYRKLESAIVIKVERKNLKRKSVRKKNDVKKKMKRKVF